MTAMRPVLRLNFSIALNYEITQPGCDFILNIHAAQTAHQTVVWESLQISQPVLPSMYTDTVSHNRYLRLKALAGLLTVRYEAAVDLAQTPLAARILIDPAFSDGYESNQSGEGGGHSLAEAEIQSPIDLTSRTPTHIRFAEAESSQLVERQPINRGIGNSENQTSQRSALSEMRRR